MRQTIEIGSLWHVRLRGSFTIVRITNIRIVQSHRAMWRADAMNELTQRPVVIKSITKLRKAATAEELARMLARQAMQKDRPVEG